MPAIDPERLKKQVNRLLDMVSDPVELQRRCVELLDFYVDRTLKSIATAEPDKTYRTFGTPKPLMRALSLGLRTRLAEQPTSMLPVAAALWQAGYRETRILASAILGELSGEAVPGWAESWALECDDQIALEELADRGLTGLRQVAPATFLEMVETWLGSTQKQLQSFGLLALQSAGEDPSFEDLPTVFRLLEGSTESYNGALFHALARLIGTLARRSPPETARFLKDELARGSRGSERVIQYAMDFFPIRQRDLLERALSRKNQAGIIHQP